MTENKKVELNNEEKRDYVLSVIENLKSVGSGYEETREVLAKGVDESLDAAFETAVVVKEMVDSTETIAH